MVTLKKFLKRDLSIIVGIKYRDNSLNQRILIKFRDVEDFFWIEITTLIPVDFLEPCVEFLDFFLAELRWKLDAAHYSFFFL